MMKKKRYTLGLVLVLIVIVFGMIYINGLDKKQLSNIEAINKIYSRNISGMGLGVGRTSNLHGRDIYDFISETGNKDNNFSADSQGGVRLSAARQLFSSIKNLKVLNEALPEFFEKPGNEYYTIQTHYDYYGKDTTGGLYYLTLFVNTNNYHIYISKDYYEPNKLLKLSTIYVEYEPNEITKKLVNDIVKK